MRSGTVAGLNPEGRKLVGVRLLRSPLRIGYNRLAVATLTITNLTAEAVYVRDLYTAVPAGGSTVVERRASDFARMDGLQALVGSGKLDISVDYTAEETLSHMVPYAGEAGQVAGVIHFNVGSLVKKVEAPVPGTPYAEAMADYGQLGFWKHQKIDVFHIHLIKNGTSGALTIEWYLFQNFLTTRDLTYLGSATLDYTAGHFATAAFVPTNLSVGPGEYMLAQATDLTSIVNGNGDGLTLDVHFH